VRNAGVKNLYQRGKGKIFYYVKDGKWISLRTRVRAEARRQLEHLRQQEIALKFLKKTGLLTHLLQANGFPPRNSGETFMPGDPPDPATPLTTQYSLAPSFAKSERPDFAELANDFVARVACKSASTHRMWRTRNAALIKLLSTVEKFNQQDVTKLSAWEKLDRLSPSGVWMAYKETGAGNSSLNQMGCYLRMLIPRLVELQLVAPWFVSDATKIPRMASHVRQPIIPSPEEMEQLLSSCEARDYELGQLIRFFCYSGARKGAALDKTTGVTWDRIDFANRDITLWQKGDRRHKVPMGPQLHALLLAWRECTGGTETARVFPLGSTREDKAQSILKKVSAELGGNLRDMSHFHAFKHYFKSQHQRQGTPDSISDLLTFNQPAGRRGSGDTYRHDTYEVMRQSVERVTL
jgi:integrase